MSSIRRFSTMLVSAVDSNEAGDYENSNHRESQRKFERGSEHGTYGRSDAHARRLLQISADGQFSDCGADERTENNSGEP